MSFNTKFKLSFMMFLEFFIWGGWFVTLGLFLGNNLGTTGAQDAAVFSTQSLGAIIAPFIIGLIADKYFNAERILGVLHLIGAALMFQMYNAQDFEAFYPYVFAYMVAYMPTLALVNSVSFNQMSNPEKEFGVIRVWGTIGWIVAGLIISLVFAWDSTENAAAGMLKYTFLMTCIASLVLGIYSFLLPKTPPKIAKGEKKSLSEILGLDAFALLKDRNYLVFFLSSILICIPLAFYYQNASKFFGEIGMTNLTSKMALGQGSEVLFMLLLPVFFGKFGVKKTLLVGMIAWVARYALFAYGNVNELSFMLLTGIALHGICYDFFFVSGQIYTDSKAGEKFKSAAQGMITLATYGVGMLIGFWVAGWAYDTYEMAEKTHNWQTIWLIPSGIAVLVALIFALAFREKKPKPVAA